MEYTLKEHIAALKRVLKEFLILLSCFTALGLFMYLALVVARFIKNFLVLRFLWCKENFTEVGALIAMLIGFALFVAVILIKTFCGVFKYYGECLNQVRQTNKLKHRIEHKGE